MSFHRTIVGVCTALFATVSASAAFAQCCGGVGIAPVVAPVAVVQEVIQPVMAVQPVIPAVPVVAAPIAVDNWDTNGWGCGGGCGCGGCGGYRGCGGCGGFVGGCGGGCGGFGGCGGGCGGFGYRAAVAPLYTVNQGPMYSGPGM